MGIIGLENNKLYHAFQLYEGLINYGYNIRKTSKSGHDAWMEIKNKIPEQLLVWSYDATKYYVDLTTGLAAIPDVEPVKLNSVGQYQWERNYFLLQHGRVVKKYPQASLAKLLQIAYNTGQFLAENEIVPYPQAHLQYFANKQLNKITSFIQVDSLENVNSNVYREVYDVLRSIVIGDKTIPIRPMNNYALNDKNDKNNNNNIKNEKKVAETSPTSSETPKTVTDTTTSTEGTKTESTEEKKNESTEEKKTESTPETPKEPVAEAAEAVKVEEKPKTGGNYKIHFSDYLKALKKENQY
jgi:hypothetical protein